jgi:hypothetical protein
LITKVIIDACARGLASSQGGALNIQTDDETPAVKVKKASVTSGKALNLVEEAELSEPEEAPSTETDEVSEEVAEASVEINDEPAEEVPTEDLDESEDASKNPEEEK